MFEPSDTQRRAEEFAKDFLAHVRERSKGREATVDLPGLINLATSYLYVAQYLDRIPPPAR